VVAGGASGLGVNRELLFKFFTEVKCGLQIVTRLRVFGDICVAIMEIENLLKWAEMFFRSPVAL
jgi:hypothetical protein